MCYPHWVYTYGVYAISKYEKSELDFNQDDEKLGAKSNLVGSGRSNVEPGGARIAKAVLPQNRPI